MVMTDSEILKSYNEAKSKTKQVGVLADLNGCSRKEMAAHLTALGAEVPERSRRGGGRTPPEGTPLSDLANTLAALRDQYPEARVTAKAGEITGITVISRLGLDGAEIWTEIQLESGARSRG